MLSFGGFTSRRPGVADLLNWAFPIADGVILNKDGSLLAGWFYRGPDLESSPDERLNYVTERINSALARIQGGWAIWVDAVKLEVRKYLPIGRSFFPDQLSYLVDEERRAAFMTEGVHYETEYVWLIHYMPPTRRKGKIIDLIYDDPDADEAGIAESILAGFDKAIGEIEDSLFGVLSMSRMKDYQVTDEFGATHRRSSLVNYLHFSLTGEEVEINLPPSDAYLDTLIGGKDFYHGETPVLGGAYIACVSISGYPAFSSPAILAVLDSLAIPYRYSTRYIAIDAFEARTQVKAIERKWTQKIRGFWADVLKIQSSRVDRDAAEMAEDAGNAISRTNSGQVGTGYYTPIVVLRGATAREAGERARAVVRQIQSRAGFVCSIEGVGATDAFFGTLPGHTYPNVQRPPIHTDNLSDFLPTSSVWCGHQTNPSALYPPDSPALMQVSSTGITPFWLNLYFSDLGHTLVFGPPGAGKSTLLTTIAMQALRYPGMTIWYFDKGRSAFATSTALGGRHYDLGTDGGLSLCPLSVLETEADQAWAEEWIGTCYHLQHGEDPGTREREEIHGAILRLRHRQEGRSLTHFVSEVQDERVQAAMRHYTLGGAMGYMLDSERDALVAGNIVTFEIEEMMEMGPKNLIPVLLYLFRRFQRQLRGQPAMLIIDEAWVVLAHEAFKAKVWEWLRVLRRANCAVVMATHLLSDVHRSGMMDMLVSSCPTKIYLPDPEAAIGTQTSGPAMYYKGLGLNETQIDIIRSAVPKRHYYVVSPEGCRLIDLRLGPIALAFAGTSSKVDIERVKRCIEAHGNDWPKFWLEERGVKVPWIEQETAAAAD